MSHKSKKGFLPHRRLHKAFSAYFNILYCAEPPESQVTIPFHSEPAIMLGKPAHLCFGPLTPAVTVQSVFLFLCVTFYTLPFIPNRFSL